MNAKQNYVAPEMELVEIQIESSVLTTLSGGEGTANGTKMETGNWGTWDE